ncbi:MAG: O-antigen ligase family protein [Actinobacteria bacterium]|nr:O-antigen ligase family protein [Actinomycetota bacterium]
MRPPLTTLGSGALLAGPTALAFFTGGYFEGPRLTAGVVAGGLVLLAALVAPRPLPRSASGRLTIAAMALFVLWTGLSIIWAPIGNDAYADLERVLVYLGVLVAAAALLRGRAVLTAVEPALALGTAVVITYGLSERLLPGLLHFQESVGATGRLEQPLTYWNAMGALAAIGIVLSARLAGDVSRPVWLRAAAAVWAAPLGTGFYLTLSRGAYASLIVGGLILAALSPTRSQLRGALVVVLAGAVPAAVASQLGSVQTLEGSLGHRETQGAIVLAVLVVAAGAAAAAMVAVARAERVRRLRTAAFGLPRRWILSGAVPVVMVALIVLGGVVHERHHAFTYTTPTSSASRLVSLSNDRYHYWGVALESFAAHPLIGVGSGGFLEEWLAHRPITENVRDAHSLYLETAAELGLVGLVLLGGVIAGAAGASIRAVRIYPVRAPGMVAAVGGFAVHAGLDWDWEFPALSLVAIVLIGALIAAGDPAPAGALRRPAVSAAP